MAGTNLTVSVLPASIGDAMRTAFIKDMLLIEDSPHMKGRITLDPLGRLATKVISLDFIYRPGEVKLERGPLSVSLDPVFSFTPSIQLTLVVEEHTTKEAAVVLQGVLGANLTASATLQAKASITITNTLLKRMLTGRVHASFYHFSLYRDQK